MARQTPPASSPALHTLQPLISSSTSSGPPNPSRLTSADANFLAYQALDLPPQMAESNGVSDPPASAAAAPGSEDVSAGKGKGKAVESSIGTSAPAQDIEMDDEDDEDEDEVEAPEVEEEDEDNMEEIDTSNIITGGRRTRGKQIDYEEAERKAKEAGDTLENDEDEDEDDDFEEPDEDDEMHE